MKTTGYMNIIVKDPRISVTRIFIIAALLISIAGTLTADIRASNKFMLLPMYLALATCGFIGLFWLRHKKTELLIFSLLTAYIWAAYPLKLVLTINDPTTLWASGSFFPASLIQKEISGSFFTITPGLIALFLGFLIGHKQTSLSRNPGSENYALRQKTFIFIISALMVLKIFNQTVLDIGIPGIRPHVLPIPYLTGILEMLSRPVLFALVNVYFYSVLQLRERRGLQIASLLLLINLLLGLRVGYKSELVFQGLLVFYYIFDLREYLSRSRRRFISIVAIFLVVSTVTLYPLVNYYRNYLLSGQNISQAADSAQAQAEKYQESFFISFYNRINGIGAYYVATKLGKGSTFPVNSLFSEDVMDLIKKRLYGSDKKYAVASFGTTQFSVLYLIGGVVFLSFGSFVIGWSIRWTASLMRQRAFKYIGIFDAYLPLFCILWVKVLASGGLITLYLKELALVAASLYAIDKTCYVRKRHPIKESRS